MSPRDALHQLVDDLPEGEVPAAARLLAALRDAQDRVGRALAEAPFDDEPDDDDFDGALAEARAEADAGGGVTTEELRRRLSRS